MMPTQVPRDNDTFKRLEKARMHAGNCTLREGGALGVCSVCVCIVCFVCLHCVCPLCVLVFGLVLG